MALSIIGTGFGRTGTASLKLALEQLGFGPCHHMMELFGNTAQVNHWAAVARGEPVDWHEVFAGYRSQVDWPGAAVWRETRAVWPEAKVIHSRRPEDKWWESFADTIGRVMSAERRPDMPPERRVTSDMTRALIGIGEFGGRFTDRDSAIAAYRTREAEVRATVPPEQLLVFDVAEGWEPLCAFLGVDAPDTPFPRTNDREQFLARLGALPD